MVRLTDAVLTFTSKSEEDDVLKRARSSDLRAEIGEALMIFSSCLM